MLLHKRANLIILLLLLFATVWDSTSLEALYFKIDRAIPMIVLAARGPKGGGYAGKQENPYASGGKGGNKKTIGAATALGLGPLPQQNTMLSGLAGLGMAQQNPLDSLFGSAGTNTLAGLGGLNTGLGLHSANGCHWWQRSPSACCTTWRFATAACLVSSCACSAPAGTTGACTTTGNAGRSTTSRNPETNRGSKAEATKRAEELVKVEKENQKQKSAQDTNATKPDEDDTTSQG